AGASCGTSAWGSWTSTPWRAIRSFVSAGVWASPGSRTGTPRTKASPAAGLCPSFPSPARARARPLSPMDARDVARVLDEIASLLELQGENPFKIRAYENAARALDGLTQDLGGLIEAGTLTGVRGFGDR